MDFYIRLILQKVFHFLEEKKKTIPFRTLANENGYEIPYLL